MRLTNYIRTLQNLPVLDQPRTDRSEDLSRAVLEEIGVIAPYTPANDGWMTQQVTYRDGGGCAIEVGSYTLSERDVRVLRRAIKIGKTADEFRRLVAEVEAVVQAGENQDDQV